MLGGKKRSYYSGQSCQTSLAKIQWIVFPSLKLLSLWNERHWVLFMFNGDCLIMDGPDVRGTSVEHRAHNAVCPAPLQVP